MKNIVGEVKKTPGMVDVAGTPPHDQWQEIQPGCPMPSTRQRLRQSARTLQRVDAYMSMNVITAEMRVAPPVPRFSPDVTDEQLMLLYRDQTDREAFEELVHRYERELYSYLCRYLGDPEQAEDAFQQTFLQVHLKCGHYDADRKVRPWLYTVATHQAIDSQRRSRRHRMLSLDRRLGDEAENETGTLVDLLADDEAGPAETVENRESCQRLQSLLGQLPAALREVVNLIYYQGLKYREAAEVLAVPVGTVKSRMHGAIQKLNELLSTPV